MTTVNNAVRSETDVAWRDVVAHNMRRRNDLLLLADKFTDCRVPDNYWRMYVCSNPDCGHKQPILETCKLRICPECERAANVKRLVHIAPMIKASLRTGVPGHSLKHIVLTTNISLFDLDITNQIKQHQKAVTATLHRVFLAAMVKHTSQAEKRRGRLSMANHGIGAVCGLEFGSKGLKLHFHVIAYCPFVAKTALSEAWEHYSPSHSHVVHISHVTEPNKATLEVLLKYATKLTSLSPDEAIRLLDALHTVRRITALGSWLGEAPDDESVVECPQCGCTLFIARRATVESGLLDLITRNISGDLQADNDAKPGIIAQPELFNVPPPFKTDRLSQWVLDRI